MNPEEYSGVPTTAVAPGDDQFKKRLRLLIALIVIAVVVFIGLALLRKPALTISSYNPGLTNITTKSTSLAITFNQPLEPGSASVSSIPNTINGTSISGNTLTLTFPQKTLLSSKTYFLTIASLKSTKGSKLTNKQIDFKPNFALPNFTGEDALTNIGLTTAQVDHINAYISQLNIFADNVTIDHSSIKHFLLNPNDAWSPWAVSFTFTDDGTTYNLVGSFFNAQDIQVTITNPVTNQQVLSAGTPGSV